MENLRLIHDFTDGTLSSGEEEQLFQMLAQNDEYRNELKQQLAIKAAVKNDTSAYSPSAKSTMKLFAALGFAAPIAGGAGASQTNSPNSASIASKANKAGFRSKYSSPILTGVISTLATAVVAILLFQPFFTDMGNKINNLKDQNQQLSKQIYNQKQNNIPIVRSNSTDNKQTTAKINSQKPIVKYVYITRDNKPNKNLNNHTLNIKSETEESSNLDLSMADIVANKVVAVSNNSFDIPTGNKFVRDMDFSNIYVRQNLGLNLEINRLINWFDKAPTINPSNYNKMNNTAISLLYDFSENLYLGAEYRQETFFQTFKGVDSKGQLNEYQQQPNFTSGGIIARYLFNGIKLYGIVPFIQFYGGITNVGYIGRGMLGLKYSPYPNISFIISGERSQLYYKYQNGSFNNGKFDLNYGVSFNL